MSKGRPSLYDKSPIGVSFQKSERSKVQVKIVTTKNIDELIDCYFEVPGIPKGAIIHDVVIGEKLSQNLLKQYAK